MPDAKGPLTEDHHSSQPATYSSFAEFYPDYLAEHQNRTSRRLHVLGTLLALIATLLCLVFWRPLLLLAVPILAYGFAWIGHFVFEKNRPTTFRYPLYSLRGDFVMLKDVLTGRIPF